MQKILNCWWHYRKSQGHHATSGVGKLQFIEWPIEAGSEITSIPIEAQIKMCNFSAEINTFTAEYKKCFWSLKQISLYI